MDKKMPKREQNLRLVAAYLKMNDEGRNALDMATQKLAELPRGTEKAENMPYMLAQNNGIFEG